MTPQAAGIPPVRQQILVCGAGGQGVLFLTRLLADAAILRGAPVLTSEIHGMAQRGGVVVSHLKVGGFASPLIREGRADGLLALKNEDLTIHLRFLKPSGWAVVNARSAPPADPGIAIRAFDADGLASLRGDSRAVNLLLLGFALSPAVGRKDAGPLFCSADDVRAALRDRLTGKESLLAASLRALDLGMRGGKE